MFLSCVFAVAKKRDQSRKKNGCLNFLFCVGSVVGKVELIHYNVKMSLVLYQVIFAFDHHKLFSETEILLA
jgi:hypothetical protein